MLDLIKKDFIACWIFLLGVAIFIPFITTMAIWAMMDDFGGLIIGVFTFITIALCIASSFIFIGIDTASNADMIYASLPIKRSTIVYARYFSSMLQVIVSFALIILTCLSSIYIFNKTDPAFELLLSLRGITSMITFLLLILSFILPFVFKFAFGKGISAALITQICFVISVPVFKFLIKALNGIWEFDIAFFSKLLDDILKWIISLPRVLGVYAYLLIFTIVSMMIFISIILSVRFYNRRDL